MVGPWAEKYHGNSQVRPFPHHSTANMAQSNTLTRGVFAKLSPHEYLLANLQPIDPSSQQPSRTNGRRPDGPRPLQIHAGSLSHTHGSAVVRNGDTTVICGVRGEILPVSHIPHYRPRSKLEQQVADAEAEGRRGLRDYDLVVPNIELATGSSPMFLPGSPPTVLAQTLSTRVYALLHYCGLLDIEDLRIWHTPLDTEDDGGEKMDEGNEEYVGGEKIEAEVKAFWTLYIDLLFISFDGNPFDAAWAAVLAALRNTKLPRATWDADREMAVCSRQDRRPLNIRGFPIALTAAVFLERERDGGKHWILLDPDRLEESLCHETITMVVERLHGETRIRSISKSGGTAIGPEYIRRFVGFAERRWEELQKVMEQK